MCECVSVCICVCERRAPMRLLCDSTLSLSFSFALSPSHTRTLSPTHGRRSPEMLSILSTDLVFRKVDIRLPEKVNSNSHGARPVHQIISMIKWICTSTLSMKNSLACRSCRPTRCFAPLSLHSQMSGVCVCEKDVFP